MLPCVLIGDSIAVGVGQAWPECETIAQVGITSVRYLTTLLPPGRLDADLAVISLGVNDDATVETMDNLRQVRARMAARRVVWLLPGLKDHVRDIIRTVAAEHGDRTLDTRPQVGRDRLHPTGAGYETIATTLIGPATGVEVAYAPFDARPVPFDTPSRDVRRPLRALATPAERIRRQRALRQAEAAAPRRSPRAPTHATIRGTMRAQDHAARATPAPGRTRVVATCTGLSRACAGKPRPVRG